MGAIREHITPELSTEMRDRIKWGAFFPTFSGWVRGLLLAMGYDHVDHRSPGQRMNPLERTNGCER
jgi:hypothetical protein